VSCVHLGEDSRAVVTGHRVWSMSDVGTPDAAAKVGARLKSVKRIMRRPSEVTNLQMMDETRKFRTGSKNSEERDSSRPLIYFH